MAMTPELFWSTVRKLGGGKGCWLRGKARGYAVVTREDGSAQSAHRYAYELARGPLADNVVVDHKCQNIRCVNPDHLEAVSQAENVRRGWEGRPHPPKRVAYALQLQKPTHRALQKIAKQERRSLNEIINIACEEMVARRATGTREID